MKSFKIFAKGGGSLLQNETLEIDNAIVKTTGKKNPKALFIPTASRDESDYCKAFEYTYKKKLGCTIENLLLFKENLHPKIIQKKIVSADIIYVGGGNTMMMMRKWRSCGIDKLLIKSLYNGTICSGSSAGALCWFEYGHSDSMFYYHPDKWDYIRVKCLGVLPYTGCPHYRKENRSVSFHKMIMKTNDKGIAIDDRCAIEFTESGFKVWSDTESAHAYYVVKEKNIITQQQIHETKNYSPYTSL